MSFFFPKVEKMYVYKRKGTQDDPYVPISESLKVVNSRVILKEVPDLFTKVTVKDNKGNFLYETTSLTPNANEYRVDYSLGIVYFNSSNEGKEFTFDYQGVGLIAFPASRIWTRENNGEIVETLQTLIDETEVARDTVNEAVTAANNAASNVNTKATYAQQQGDYAKAQGDYAKTQGDYAKAQGDAANLAATNANDAANNANAAATSANNAAASANKAADNANTKATNAQTQADYAKSQGDYAKTQGDYAKAQGDYAKAQGDYTKQVANENKTRWLTAVNTYADIATTYPNPQLGDTVQTINDSKIYRWDGTQWVWTQQYNANAITDVQSKIGILSTADDVLFQNDRSIFLEIDKYKKLRFQQGVATITGVDSNGYFRDNEPFIQVTLTGYTQINAPNYAVVIDIISSNGDYGQLIVYDKTQNGFKVKMTGSASSVTFMWTLLNPLVA